MVPYWGYVASLRNMQEKLENIHNSNIKKNPCSFSSGFYSDIIYLKIDIYAFTLEFGPVFCALCGKSFELLIKNVSLGNHRLKAPMTKSIKFVLLSLPNRAEKYFSNSFILVLNITSNLCSLNNVISVVNFKLLKPSQNKKGRKFF